MHLNWPRSANSNAPEKPPAFSKQLFFVQTSQEMRIRIACTNQASCQNSRHASRHTRKFHSVVVLAQIANTENRLRFPVSAFSDTIHRHAKYGVEAGASFHCPCSSAFSAFLSAFLVQPSVSAALCDYCKMEDTGTALRGLLPTHSTFI